MRSAAVRVAVATLMLTGLACAGRSPGELLREPDAERVQALARLAVPLASIDPADDDFSDLEPLRAALAGVRVVVLGEATHGEGETFRAKARLIRFLHRELGYDVLAFESGFYDTREAWRRIEEGADPEGAFRSAVFPIWTRSAQVAPVIDHFAAAARSERPLALAGFDPQFTGSPSEERLLDDLVRLAAAEGLPAELFRERIAGPLANLVEARYEAGDLPAPPERESFLAALAELAARLRGEVEDGGPDRAFWLRLVESTAAFADVSWRTDFSRGLLEDPETYQVRERLMGEQLAWLAREGFPGRKIIAWMHSGHAARGLAGVEAPSEVHRHAYRTLKPAGHVARELLGDELYTVGFLAHEGEYATVFQRRPIEIWKPTEGSLEDLLHRAGLRHAFLDLSRPSRLPRWLREPTIARPIGYMEMRARWPEVYDGLVFLDRMEISRRLP